MQIELTSDEYRRLIDILYLADWLLTAHKVGDDPRVAAYQQLVQKLYAYSQEMGLSHLIEYAVEFDQYFPTRDLEAGTPIHEFIDEYDDETFWDELTRRLAERDLLAQLGGWEKMQKLSTEERIRRLGQLEEHYAAEFARHGLENLRLESPNNKAQWRHTQRPMRPR
ncbi:MAG: hypothetical protein KF832_21725 [Caldilineaceae bacterium]|nr:hypothetical protein [Caldilineaceae bacterium]